MKTLEEFETSISCGANFLKVHPSSAVSPESLSIILDKVGKTVLDSSQPWRTFVSGSIEPRHILPYLQAGATDFIVGLDAAQLSHSEMKQKLDEMDWELERVREQLRDTPMLRSVCL